MLGIRILRFSRGMTLHDVFQLTGIHASRLSLIERGKIFPTRDQLLALAEALSWPLDEIDTLFRPAVDHRLRRGARGRKNS